MPRSALKPSGPKATWVGITNEVGCSEGVRDFLDFLNHGILGSRKRSDFGASWQTHVGGRFKDAIVTRLARISVGRRTWSARNQHVHGLQPAFSLRAPPSSRSWIDPEASHVPHKAPPPRAYRISSTDLIRGMCLSQVRHLTPPPLNAAITQRSRELSHPRVPSPIPRTRSLREILFSR